MNLKILDPADPEELFPPVNQALTMPGGLLAVGGCLSTTRLINAYRQGIFPWSGKDEPILWWSPDPRLVLFPSKLIVSHSLAKTLRQKRYRITVDQNFAEVINACAETRKDEAGTWITEGVLQSYQELHQSGFAHSVEAWEGERLVGGLYGVALGRVFFGESMFFKAKDASKTAFATMVNAMKEWQFHLIDCQISTQHLKNFGAEEIPRSDFINLLDLYCEQEPAETAWRLL
ncbi:MAG: leucyl/phenylalanyl-tRNA--protein transferase [Gammaproteobacteria bacterium]|nr:leucyl/phenylalanyl-tRNA--protein transferase [Gammaproteobacteria bacterium]